MRVAFLLMAAPLLGGCVASMAMSAAGMAAKAAEGQPVSNAELAPAARDACTAQAAQYGTVNVIDVEQHSIDKIIVWGTVEGTFDGGKERRSFQCDYGTKVTAFRLRKIKAAP